MLVRSDRDSEFKNALMWEVTRLFGIQQQFYDPPARRARVHQKKSRGPLVLRFES